MKYKKLTEAEQKEFDRVVKLLLYGGLDYCHTNGKDQYWWFSPLNPYYCEAFGMYQTLQILGYGFFGAVNFKDEFNLRYQIGLICEEVEKVGQEMGGKGAYEWYKKKNLENL